jgi:putative transposase
MEYILEINSEKELDQKTKVSYRTSRHKIFPNKGKQDSLNLFISEYKNLVSKLIDHVWDRGYADYYPSKGSLEAPKFFDSTFLETFQTSLGGMLRQTAGLQALGILKGATTKHSKRVYQLKKLQKKLSRGEASSKEQQSIKILQSKVNKNSLVKPSLPKDFKITISRPDVVKVFKQNKNNKSFSFDEFIRLSLAGDHGTLTVPLNYHKHSKKLLKKGAKRKISAIALLSNKEADLIWEIECSVKTEGEVVGCDQGVTTCLSMSDGQFTKKNKHGKDLTDIQKTLSRRKPDSKGYKRAQAERKNYVNWCLNELTFNNVKEVRLEKIFQIRKGKNTSNYLKRWKYTLIKEKLERLSESEGFTFTEVPNKFRSQRCSSCGYVNKKNRKGKTFLCRSCGHTADADMNAAANLRLCLCEVPLWVFDQQINRTGFYWTENEVIMEEQVIPPNEKSLTKIIH